MTRIPPPPGHVGLDALIGKRRATRARSRTLGLVPFDAAGLWAAIDRNEFPAPTAGPWGIAWPIDVIDRWRRSHVKTPPAVSAAGGVKGKADNPKSTPPAPRRQARTYTCVGCDQPRPMADHGTAIYRGVTCFSTRLPVCTCCANVAIESPRARDRIEGNLSRYTQAAEDRRLTEEWECN